MSCTPEEIEEKRRIAQEKLKARRIEQKISPVKSTSSFYGNTSSLPQNSLITKSSVNPFLNSALENKAKAYNPYKSSRILSQPYPHQKPSPEKNGTPTSFNQDYSKSNKSIAPVFRKIVTCVSSMITDDRFTVIPSSYHNQLIEVFKTIPSKTYDRNTTNWSFSLKDYDLVQERVNNLKPDVVIGTIPRHVFKVFNEPLPDASLKACLRSIEPTLMNALMPFQKEGVLFGIQKQGRCLIADEMGLGKTYQALAIADFYRDEFPLLICTTATTRNVWMTKVRSLLPHIPVHYIVCLTSTNDYFGDAKVLVVSYALLEKSIDKIMEKQFGVIVMDESHILKNFKAKCTTVALRLAKQARRVILLSGTPALSRPVELFTQLQLIDPKFLGYKEYTTRYCEGKQSNFGWDASGQSNLTELNLILNKKFMIRRTKSEVLSELAEKNREMVILDPTYICASKENQESIDSLASTFDKSKGREKEEILLKFYSETASFKSKAVCAYIKDLIKEDKKFLVFGHHLVMLNAISDCLRKLKVDFIRIDGSTKNDVRTANVKHFQNDKDCRVAVLSLKACNTGITLTAAQLVIFAELDWNPTVLSQAESRAHRIGQEGTVTIRYLLAANTADDVIWKMLKNKQMILNKAGLCDENFSDAACTSGPTGPASNTIENYFEIEKNNISTLLNENDSNKMEEKTKNKIDETEQISKNTDYLSLLDDGDEELANLIF